MCDPLTDFLTTNNIIGNQQFGFSKGTSAIDQLLEMYHRIVSTMDRQMLTKVIFLDVSMAFDKVWRRAVIHKLRKYGIRGKLLSWFTNYLEDRLQRVVLKGYFSTWQMVIAGVPQGSILGPILYLVFAEDMKEVIDCGLRMFADDTTLYSPGITEKACADVLQPNLDRLCLWARSWKITLNASKTKCLTFSRVSTLCYPLIMDNLFVLEVMVHKHLGLYLSSDGKWSNHLTQVGKKITKRLAIMKAYSRRISRPSLSAIYYAYVRPIMEYATVVMSNLNTGDAEIWEEYHRAGIRAVTGCKVGTSHSELLRKMDEKPLSDRRLALTLTKFFSLV